MKSLDPHNFSPSLSTSLGPDFAAQPALTIGQGGHTPLAELARLAVLGHSEWQLRQLMTLAAYDADNPVSDKYVGAYIHFITESEVIAVLESWAVFDRRASSVLRLSECLSCRPDLISRIRPFTEAQRAAKEMRGSLTEEPMTAMIAARRVVRRDDPDLPEWIDRLRLFLLIRGLELLEVGATHDRFLSEACTATRKACDRDSSDQIKWLALLASRTSDIADFQADLEHRCILARSNKSGTAAALPQTARHLFATIGRIASGGTWWDPKSLKAIGGSVPAGGVLGLRDPSLPASAPPLPPSLPSNFRGIVTVSGGAHRTRLVAHVERVGATPRQSRRHGKEILLAAVEYSMYLPSTWHRLTAAEEMALTARIRDLLASETLLHRTGGVLVLIAWVTARSMFDVETIVCSESLDDDWTLDIATGVLRRHPPRFQRGIDIDALGPDALAWLQPRATQLEVELCSEAAAALHDAASSLRTAADIGALWKALSPDLPLNKWFDDSFTNIAGLKRLSSPVTAGAMGAAVFAAAGDAVFAL